MAAFFVCPYCAGGNPVASEVNGGYTGYRPAREKSDALQFIQACSPGKKCASSYFFDSAWPIREKLSRRSRRLRNTAYHLAEAAIHIGDLGRHAAGQIAKQKRGDVADFLGRDVAADR